MVKNIVLWAITSRTKHVRETGSRRRMLINMNKKIAFGKEKSQLCYGRETCSFEVPDDHDKPT